MRFKCFTLPILTAALMLGGCSVDEDSLRRPMPEPTQMRGPGKVSPDYLIIKLKNEVSDPMSLASELPELKIKSVSRMYPGPAKYEARKRAMGLHLWYIVNFDRSVPVTRAATDIAAADNIESIHYVRSLKPADAPETWPFNDPELPNQWHYMNYIDGANSKPGSDINLFPAWEITTGSPEVVVAVIDSGVDYRHEDLSGNMWVNEAELNGQPGVDDDGNGYTDDIYGYNFTTTFSGSTDNIDEVTNRDITPCDHGTHVAGTIAAMNNNGKGVSGIAGGDWAAGKPGVRIMSLQTMNDAEDGAFISSAFVYAADNGAVITQNSWGWDEFSQELVDYLEPALEYFQLFAGNDVQVDEQTDKILSITQSPGSPMSGGINIFAAGNESSNDSYPGNSERVFAVASIGADYEAAYYTNYGSWVEVAAPGGDSRKNQEILSTLPGNQYGKMQGTSMACPHVTGVAALVVSQFGGQGFTNKQLWNILLGGTRDIDQYQEKAYVGQLGSGLIDAELCLKGYGPEPPEPVTDLALSSPDAVNGTSVELEWTVPADKDSGQPAYFEIYYSESSLENLDPEKYDTRTVSVERVDNTEKLATGEKMTHRITDLKNSTAYYFRIRAVDNVFSASALSPQISVATLSNTAPVITPLNGTDTTIRKHQYISMRFGLSDEDGDALEVSLADPGSDAATLSSDGETATLIINGLNAPESSEPVTYTAVLRLSDGQEAALLDVHYTILPNAAPVLAADPEGFCINGVNGNYTLDMSSLFSDSDGETLMYNASSSDGGTILSTILSGSNLTLTGVSLGQTELTLVAYDASKASASVTIPVLVRDAGRKADFYPNPVTDFLNIRTGEAVTSASVQVLAANGAAVLTENDMAISPFAPVQIDMTSLSGGMYTVILSYTAADGSTQSTTTQIAKL